MISLALRQLLENKKRTLITIIGIVLSVSMITAVAGLVMSTREMMRQTYIAHNGDSHATIFPVTPAQIEAIAADERVESSYTKISEREDKPGTAIYFRIRDVDRNYEAVTAQIARDYQVIDATFDYNQELLAVEGVIAADRSLMTVITIGVILGLIISIASVIVIANAFEISASERLQQFGILKSVGATKEQIQRVVLAEGLILSVVAIPLGIIFGFVVEWVALLIANNLLSEVNAVNDGVLHLDFIISGLAVAISIGLSLITVFLSAWFPARRASKVSAIEAISLTNEVKIKTGSAKVSPLIQKIFGFEGSLAAKALKRSRRKYRATVIALVVSIVLFILGSGFSMMIKQSTDVIYRDFGVNVIMYYRQATPEAISDLTNKLSVLSTELSSSQYVTARADIAPAMISKEAKKNLNDTALYVGDETGVNLQLITVNDTDFAEILAAAKLSAETLENEEQLTGILVNFDVVEGNNQRGIFQPFNYSPNEIINFNRVGQDEPGSIKLAGEITDVTTSIAPYVNSGRLNIIISTNAFAKLTAGELIPEAYWVTQTTDSAAFAQAAEKIFAEVQAGLIEYSPDGKYAVVDYAQNAKLTQDINLLMQVFVYGFLAMMTLIAVTSVLGTITTNINLRLPEMAMLTSVGMTTAGLHKMLNLESFFYGLRALAIGLPISLVLYWLMYKAFSLSIGFTFFWPWSSIALCVVAVMFITFITMNYATKILRNKNIVELIRMMNI